MPAFAPSRQRSPIADDLLAAARERAHDRRAAADVGAVADDDAGARSGPRPSTRRACRRCSCTKPSCITVVPAARCAPSRTRSASAIRTPVGTHVVDHPRELVDAVHRHRPARAQPRPRRPRSRPPRTGRGWSRRRWRAARRRPSRLTSCGRDQPVRRAGAGAGRRPRRRRAGRPASRSRVGTTVVAHPAVGVRAGQLLQASGTSGASPPSDGRGVPGVEDRSRRRSRWPARSRRPASAGAHGRHGNRRSDAR